MQSKGKLEKLDALSKLKAAREGESKRALEFEAKKEEGLYEVMEDEEYARLVAKRREEGGELCVALMGFESAAEAVGVFLECI